MSLAKLIRRSPSGTAEVPEHVGPTRENPRTDHWIITTRTLRRADAVDCIMGLLGFNRPIYFTSDAVRMLWLGLSQTEAAPDDSGQKELL